ncbi:DUF7344 domain-containing protein [Natronococcus jeotgali]
MPESTQSDAASIFNFLSRPCCREITYYLLENREMSVETLSRRLTAEEHDVTPEREQRRVRTSLIHDLLPRLEEDGLLEFDPRSGSVTRTEAFDARRDEIERARALDEGLRRDEGPLESVRYAEPSAARLASSND